MTKEEVVKLLVLIESVYPNCILKNETVQQWFEFCSEMDYKKVLSKLKNHIRKSPFPPAIDEIAVFHFEENLFPATLQEWMKEGRVRIEYDYKSNKLGPLPAWLAEYSPRKSV
jgi:Loader and inhibitor of phage G40P